MSLARTAAWFCRPDQPDARFNQRDFAQLADGDRVRAQLSASGRANLVAVLERARPSFPASIGLDRWLEPIGLGLPARCPLHKSEKTELTEGTLVVARWLPAAKGDFRNPGGYARIERQLGPPDGQGVAAELALLAWDIPCQWPEPVLAECETLPDLASTPDARTALRRKGSATEDGRLDPRQEASSTPDGLRDLRQQAFFTVDGASARDFDDAVHCAPLSGGGWRLQVAIADVSFYVRVGSALDREAAHRGTSVYFSDRAVPMLPPVLSEDKCSLRPGEDRPVLVCDMQIDAAGKVREWAFHRALIRSAARFVYDRLEPALKRRDCKHPAAEGLSAELRHFRDAARALTAARRKRGALQLDLPEVSAHQSAGAVQLTEDKRLESHQLIEDAMLAANSCAARQLKQQRRPAPRRVCDRPDDTKWRELCQLLQRRGLEPPGDRPDLAACNRLLERIADRPDRDFLQYALLRTLQQAFYSTAERGHFPLALDDYCHFTSPIRRYPDLLVHRLLCPDKDEATASPDPRRPSGSPPDDGEKAPNAGDRAPVAAANLDELCASSSAAERRADRASIQEQRHLKCLLAREKIGQWLQGTLNRLYRDGAYFHLPQLGMNAFISMQRIRNRGYRPGGFARFGQPSELRRDGVLLSPGSSLQVRLQSVRPERQEILLDDLRPERPAEAAPGR